MDNTRKIALFIKYDGTAYHGFQVQKNARTIQETVQDALESLFGHETTVCGCSRTDAGVHAKQFCILTQTHTVIPAEKLPFALNTKLPDDISAFAAYEVDDGFHPRYSAVAKEYEYHIYVGRTRDPFLEKYAYWEPRKFDVELFKTCAVKFEGTHDFAAFMASGSDVEDTVRTMYLCRAEEKADTNEIVVRLKANGFLYNMVRIIVGTLIDAASGRIDPDEIENIILSKDRKRAGFTVPAKGLFLNKIEYGENTFKNGREE